MTSSTKQRLHIVKQPSPAVPPQLPLTSDPLSGRLKLRILNIDVVLFLFLPLPSLVWWSVQDLSCRDLFQIWIFFPSLRVVRGPGDQTRASCPRYPIPLSDQLYNSLLWKGSTPFYMDRIIHLKKKKEKKDRVHLCSPDCPGTRSRPVLVSNSEVHLPLFPLSSGVKGVNSTTRLASTFWLLCSEHWQCMCLYVCLPVCSKCWHAQWAYIRVSSVCLLVFVHIWSGILHLWCACSLCNHQTVHCGFEVRPFALSMDLH